MRPKSEPWNGEWILLAVSRSSPHARRRLRFDGFRPASRGAFARPAWPREHVVARADALIGREGGVYVIGALGGDSAMAECVRGYELEGLRRRVAVVRARVERVLSTPPTGARALALRLEIGEAIARLFSIDPHLPPSLWDGSDPFADLASLHARFERVLERASAPYIANVLAKSRRAARTA